METRGFGVFLWRSSEWKMKKYMQMNYNISIVLKDLFLNGLLVSKYFLGRFVYLDDYDYRASA